MHRAADDRQPGYASLKIGSGAVFQLQLELIGDQGDELTICRLSFCIGNRVAEEPLQCVQIPSVPGYLNGVADGSFHSAGIRFLLKIAGVWDVIC